MQVLYCIRLEAITVHNLYSVRNGYFFELRLHSHFMLTRW